MTKVTINQELSNLIDSAKEAYYNSNSVSETVMTVIGDVLVQAIWSIFGVTYMAVCLLTKEESDEFNNYSGIYDALIYALV